MTYDYPAFEALNTAPDYLYIPCYWTPPAPIRPATRAACGPVGRSEYIGVQFRRGKWVAQWGGARQRVTGKQHADPLDAAWERARALGLSAPEVRR